MPRSLREATPDVAVRDDGAVVLGGETILEPCGRRRGAARLADVEQARETARNGGCFLSFSLRKARSKCDVDLGLLPPGRILSIARNKRWWITPAFGEVPIESQAVFVEGDKVDSQGLRTYSLVLPLLAGQDPLRLQDGRHAFRCAIRGEVENDRTRVVACVESGDPLVRARDFDGACYVAAVKAPDAGCVHALLGKAMDTIAARKGSFKTLSRKAPPKGMVQGLGWCTWDAFYSSVDAQKIEDGLKTLAQITSVRRLIVDDGWMKLDKDTDETLNLSGEILKADEMVNPDIYDDSDVLAGVKRRFAETVGSAYAKHVERAAPNSWGVRIWRLLATTLLKGPLVHFFDESTDFTKALAWPPAPHPTKFGGVEGFTKFIKDTVKHDYGVEHVACWHAAAGYWGGVDSPDAKVLRAKPTSQLLKVEPAIAWDPATLGGVKTPTDSSGIGRVYDELYATLKKCGVDGVKADAQSGVGALGDGHGGGPRAVALFVGAMEKAGSKHFKDADGAIAVSNCMCHSTENLYRYADSAIARASDDFYPREPESWLWHLTACAYNSLLIGQVALPDWDMFQSKHPAAWLHAAARAASGGPVTVSDAPGEHDADVLRALALPDGATLVATAAARLCADCLFGDVARDGVTALKLAAPNGGEGAVLGLYNVQGGHWRRDERRFAFGENATLKSAYRPRDAAVAWDAFDAGARWAAYRFGSGAVRVLGADDAVPLTLEPAGFAVVALRRLRETRAGVAYAPLGLLDMLNCGGAVGACDEGPDGVRVAARGPGRFGVYADRAPTAVTVDGERVEAPYADGLVTVNLAAAGDRDVVLTWA